MRRRNGVNHERWRDAVRRACDAALDAWLPARCIVCGGAAPSGLCEACVAALPGSAAMRCRCCGQRSPAGPEPCAQCRADPPPFARTVVLGDYAPPLDRVVHALKFARDASLAGPLGRSLARSVGVTSAAPGPSGPFDSARGHDDPIVTAVPLPAHRLAARGFNQSLEIARAFAREQRLRLEHRLLQRVRAGAPAATLHALERRIALADAFAAPRPLAGRTVIVVDDVMTTGATLRAAAAALVGAGASHVINCVVARTAHADAPIDDPRRPGPP